MSRPAPVRTCIGCREKAAQSDLVHLVVDTDVPQRVVVLDRRGARAGRGAHLHPQPGCLELAERRRAFSRAFRLDGPLDTSEVHAWFAAHQRMQAEGPVSPETVPTDNSRKRSSGS